MRCTMCPCSRNNVTESVSHCICRCLDPAGVRVWRVVVSRILEQRRPREPGLRRRFDGVGSRAGFLRPVDIEKIEGHQLPMMRNRLNGWLLRAGLLAAAAPTSVRACAACFGKSDSDLARGSFAGVLFLLGVILTVMGGIAAFFIY